MNVRSPSYSGLIVAGALLSALAAARRPALAQITVGPNVTISADMPHAAHTEYFANADPADPRRLVACSMVIDPARSRLTTGLYLSTDAGSHWHLVAHDTTGRYGS